jgi:membrane-bound lytic murein transglycosylase A
MQQYVLICPSLFFILDVSYVMIKKAAIIVFSLLLIFLGFYLGKSYHVRQGLVTVSWRQLPGWTHGDVKQSLHAFKSSCSTFLRQNPSNNVGTSVLPLKAKDWHPACLAADKIINPSPKKIRLFFKTWFKPVTFYQDDKPTEGLFTGYYLPTLKGSLEKTDKYNIPIYGVPKDLLTVDLGDFSSKFKNQHIIARIEGNAVLPYHSRAAINQGKIKENAKILLWVDNRIDRLFLDIQGSGVIQLPNGKFEYISYEKENGRPYTALAQVFINKGLMTRDNASMQRIRHYLKAHPEEMDNFLHKNKSFVFYRKLKNNNISGAQGVTLTSGYSLAVDRKWIPLGVPMWLHTTHPDKTDPNKEQPFHRLMVAQDTGGAIKGRVRGDVYWGGG